MVEGFCSLRDEGHLRGTHEQGAWDPGREPGRERVEQEQTEVGTGGLPSMRQG